jgi:HEAT repeat protein
MSAIVGKDMSQQKILPILQDLLKDDSSEVRLNVAQNLGKLAGVVGVDILSPALIVLL